MTDYKYQFEQYLQVQKRYSVHTVLNYLSDINQFEKYMNLQSNHVGIMQISYFDIRAWIANLSNEGVSARSICRKIASLKAFYRYFLKIQVIATNPMLKINSPKIRKRLPEFIPENQMEALLEISPYTLSTVKETSEMPTDVNTNELTLRNALILRVLYECGFRRSELINLKVHQINTISCQIKVLGKGNKERIVPCSKELVELLKSYIVEYNKSSGDYLFANTKGNKLDPREVYRIVNHSLKGISTINKKSPHILRHSFATHISNNGGDLNAIKTLLGHSSLAATQIYTHNSIERLKDIYQKAHPKGE